MRVSVCEDVCVCVCVCGCCGLGVFVCVKGQVQRKPRGKVQITRKPHGSDESIRHFLTYTRTHTDGDMCACHIYNALKLKDVLPT